MLQKKRFGDESARTPRSHGPDRRDDEMSHQYEPVPHAANHVRSRRRSQVYDSLVNCGRIAIRHGPGILRYRRVVMSCKTSRAATPFRSNRRSKRFQAIQPLNSAGCVVCPGYVCGHFCGHSFVPLHSAASVHVELSGEGGAPRVGGVQTSQLWLRRRPCRDRCATVLRPVTEGLSPKKIL
jgi:hypothetical protein